MDVDTQVKRLLRPTPLVNARRRTPYPRYPPEVETRVLSDNRLCNGTHAPQEFDFDVRRRHNPQACRNLRIILWSTDV